MMLELTRVGVDDDAPLRSHVLSRSQSVSDPRARMRRRMTVTGSGIVDVVGGVEM
jgi:hypothetical protein